MPLDPRRKYRLTDEQFERIQLAAKHVADIVPLAYIKNHPDFIEHPNAISLVDSAEALKRDQGDFQIAKRNFETALAEVFTGVPKADLLEYLTNEIAFENRVVAAYRAIKRAGNGIWRADFTKTPVVVDQQFGIARKFAEFDSPDLLNAINSESGSEIPLIIRSMQARATEIANGIGAAPGSRPNPRERNYSAKLRSRHVDVVERKRLFEAQLDSDSEMYILRAEFEEAVGVAPELFMTDTSIILNANMSTIARLQETVRKLGRVQQQLGDIEKIWRGFRYSAEGQAIADDLGLETIDMFEFGKDFVTIAGLEYQPDGTRIHKQDALVQTLPSPSIGSL